MQIPGTAHPNVVSNTTIVTGATRGRIWGRIAVAVLVVCGAAAPLRAETTAQFRAETAAELYVKLRDCSLDPARVYRIRDAYLDRQDLHVKLEDGIIAFVEPVAGHVTAAFFEGDGEIYLAPPDRVERWSLNVFTGSAILEEKISSAFLRFNDDTLAELQRFFRPVEKDDAEEFLARNSEATSSLCSEGALRTTGTILNSTHVTANGAQEYRRDPADRLLILRVSGMHVGPFDIVYDSNAAEQLFVGRFKRIGEREFYDTWTSFPDRATRQSRGRDSTRATLTTQSSAENAITDSVRIGAYKLNVRVRPPRTLDVGADLAIEVLRGGERFLQLELSRYLKMSQVTADGAPIDFVQNQALAGSDLARRGNDVVAVVFSKPLVAGQHVSLHFVYSGDVVDQSGGGLMYVGARGDWYPSRGLELANFDLEFRYPAALTLVATGYRVEEHEEGAERVAHYVGERPMALAGFNLGQYQVATARAGNVPVMAYIAPALLPPAPEPAVRNGTTAPGESAAMLRVQTLADRTAKDIEYLASRLGPYPFSTLSVTPMPGAISQSWPTLIYLSTGVFLSPEERAQEHMSPFADLFFGKVMQTHEAVHQWIGDLILWKSYREQWVVEALSNYCALVKLQGESERDFQMALLHYRDQLIAKNADGVETTDAGPVTLGVRLDSSRFAHGYEAISYGRGTWLFHMLREMLRDGEGMNAMTAGGGPDDPFFRVLRTLRERFEGRQITTRDVQQAFEELLPANLLYENRKSLDWFFDTWVNGTSVPKLEVADLKFQRHGQDEMVTGRIVQSHASEALVTSVPLYTAGEKPVFLGRVFVEGKGSPFRLRVPAGTTALLLDPYYTVLRRP